MRKPIGTGGVGNTARSAFGACPARCAQWPLA